LTGTVIPCTTTTAIPSPIAVSTLLEMAMNVHIPRKKARAIFSINIDFINRLI
jgi:hypothetical protein